MNAEQFVAAHRAEWGRLNELVGKAQNARLNALTDDELHELGALYRRAAADLARVQTRYGTTSAGQELVRSLNDLVLRAHVQVFSAPPPQPLDGLAFVLYGFPATVRRQWRAILVAAVLMYLPALLAHCAVIENPALAQIFVPDSAIKEVQARAQQKLITGWGGNTHFGGLLESPAISSFIMTNNIKVTLNAVAMGVTMGIGTALVLIFNGLMLGGLSGVAMNEHVNLLFWAVILPHGILELSAITIAGGAGLLLAHAIYAPGDLPRRDAIKIAGAEAGRLVVGVALLLVVAGTIEGFITPQPIPPLLKIAFSLLTALGLLLYLNLRPRHSVTVSGTA